MDEDELKRLDEEWKKRPPGGVIHSPPPHRMRNAFGSLISGWGEFVYCDEPCAERFKPSLP